MMKKILLIRVPPATSGINEVTTVQWGEFSNTGSLSGESHISEIQSLKQEWLELQETDSSAQGNEAKQPDKVVLLLPGNWVVHRRLGMTSAQQKHIGTALPYMIEEELADDIESVHIASYIHRKDEEVSLLAISHQFIQEILSCFEDQGILIDHIFSECQLLKSEENSASLLLDTAMVTMVTPGKAALAIDYDAVAYALEQRVAVFEQEETDFNDQEHRRISQVKLIFSESCFPVPEGKLDVLRSWLAENGWLTQEFKLEHSVFEYLAESFFNMRRMPWLIDLRSGPYQCPRKASRKMRQWRPVIALAACWLVIEIGLMVGQGLYFGRQADQLWQKNAEAYLGAFPQDSQVKEAKLRNQRTFDIQRWLENRLKRVEKSSPGELFLPLLMTVSKVTADQGDDAAIMPYGMEFNSVSGHLVFEFQASNLEAVNKLMAALKSEGLQTRLDTANQDKESVLAKMTVAR